MAKIEMFWLGEGVITINGTDFGADVALPVDSINADDLKKMKTDGRIGAKIAVVSNDNKALKVLQDKIVELEGAECQDCDAVRALLETANEEIADLQGGIEKGNVELTDKIADLEKQLDEATKPAPKKDDK